MPIRPDAVNTGFNGTSSVREVVISHTCAGDDRYLLVGAIKSGSATLEATYNGVAMTPLSVEYADGIRLHVFGMANPPTGTHDVRVYYPPDTGSIYQAVISQSFTGVDTANAPTGATISNGTNATANILETLALGDVGVTFFGHNYNTTTTTNNTTYAHETAKLYGGAGSTSNSVELLCQYQWGKQINPNMTMSESRAWRMATVVLKPVDPPKVYTGLMVIPQTYNLPTDMGGGTVTLDGTSQVLAEFEANLLSAKLLDYSDGMGALDMQSLVWPIAVTEAQYTFKIGEHSGWYIQPDDMVAAIEDQVGSNFYDNYDVIAVYTDLDATTLDDSNVTGIAFERGWWSRIDASGFQSGPHEFAHTLERHLRAMGYDNWPTCTASNNSSNSIHCGNEYGYSSNSADTWLHDFFSGETTDGTGVDAAGWALPTILEYLAASLTLTASTATATATAPNATIITGASLTPDTATATANAPVATVTGGLGLVADTATATATGITATLTGGMAITADTAQTTTNGIPATLTSSIALVATTAAVTATGEIATVTGGATLAATTATATANGVDATVGTTTSDLTVTATTAIATASAPDAMITGGATLAATTGTTTATGSDVTLIAGMVLTATTGVATANGITATIGSTTTDLTLTATTATASATGATATVTGGASLAVGTATADAEAHDASLAAGMALMASTAPLVASGIPAAITGGMAIDVTTATATGAGIDAGMIGGMTLAPATAVAILAGVMATTSLVPLVPAPSATFDASARPFIANAADPHASHQYAATARSTLYDAKDA